MGKDKARKLLGEKVVDSYNAEKFMSEWNHGDRLGALYRAVLLLIAERE